MNLLLLPAFVHGEGTVAESDDGKHSAPFRNTSIRVTSASSRNEEADCLRASKSPHSAKNEFFVESQR